MRDRLLGSIAAIGLLAIGTAGTARAVPSYGYATIGFTNFTLSTPGTTLNSSSVLMTDSSNYVGFPAASQSLPGDVFTGVDAPQSFSGPGPAPAPNTFTPALTLTSGARGDGLISGAIAGGATSNLVSEGHLTTGPGTAGSTAGSSTVLDLIVSALADTTATLTFHATSQLNVSVGQFGDSASAAYSASYSIDDITDPNNPVSILIHDDINGGDSFDVTPAALNQSRHTVNPLAQLSASSPDTAYSFSAPLVVGHTYELQLGDSTQEILATVPEPLSIAVLGSGLTLLGLVRRRRRT